MWILVADGAKARLFEGDPRRGRLKLAMPELHGHGREKSSELMSDHLGRSFESHGSLRHGIQPRTDPQEQEKHRFTAHLVDLLTTAADEKRFTQLVVVVPAKMLGELREMLPKRIAGMILTELERDLTNESEPALTEHLRHLLDERSTQRQ